MFEKASRLKIRFQSPKGPLLVEDLWDLPLRSDTGKANLDDIARGLNRILKDKEDESFVAPTVRTDDELQLKFDIVKHVIVTRLAENEAASKAKENAERKQKILGIIAAKQDEALAKMSVEELSKMV
jgi:hypothetical protein